LSFNSSNSLLNVRVSHLTKINDAATSGGNVSALNSNLQPGCRVRHERFGEGEILQIEGTDANQKATVLFDNFGQKQLLLKFAKLTLV
jgi:DNA helicase-2/ATP-dependent DNA helicase PcrA